MAQQRLYVVAFYATRAVPGPSNTNEHEVSLRSALTIASTDEEAREKGLAQLFNWCPPVEGWMNHHVTINFFPRDTLLSILETISDGPSGEDDHPEWPELLM